MDMPRTIIGPERNKSLQYTSFAKPRQTSQITMAVGGQGGLAEADGTYGTYRTYMSHMSHKSHQSHCPPNGNHFHSPALPASLSSQLSLFSSLRSPPHLWSSENLGYIAARLSEYNHVSCNLGLWEPLKT
jgi:hypothetical protein